MKSCSRWLGVECGSLVLAGDEQGLTIATADPRVVMTDEWVHELECEPSDHVRYDRWEIGALVQFVGDNRTVTYRIIDCDLARGLWLLVWPD